MTETPSDKLKLIQDLLAKAEGTQNEAEADVFFAKAQELMRRYSIDTAMLQGFNHEAKPGRDSFYIHGPFAKAKNTILIAVAKNNNCQVVGSAKLSKLVDDKGAYYVHLFGFENDVAATKAMFASLLVFASAEGLRQHRYNSHVHGKAFFQSFYIGFGTRIAQRLAEMNRKVDAEVAPSGSSTALVLVGRSLAVKNKLEETFPRTVSSRLNSTSAEGRAAGIRSANSANLNKGIGNNTKGALSR